MTAWCLTAAAHRSSSVTMTRTSGVVMAAPPSSGAGRAAPLWRRASVVDSDAARATRRAAGAFVLTGGHRCRGRRCVSAAPGRHPGSR
jgi:hypothetical protein